MKRLLPLVLLLGCLAPTEPIDEPPDLAELPAGACGLEHRLLPRESVGAVEVVERLPDVSMTVEEIRTALALAGFPVAELPPQHGVDVARFRYVTQDRGELTVATSLIAVPDVSGERPLVAWLHPLAGYNDSCALSDRGLEGAAGPLLLASLGHVVVGPDYLGMVGFGEAEGQLHPGLVGEPSAIASLDALRAGATLVSELRPGLTAEPRYSLFGASEGGFTALWADRYAGWYLPEFDLVSVVSSVPALDLVGIARQALATWSPASAATAAMLVVHDDWYGLDADLEAALLNDGDPGVLDRIRSLLRDECTGGDLDDIDTFEELYQPDFRQAVLDWDSAALAPFDCTLQDSTVVGSAIPRLGDAPVLLITAEADDLALAPPTHDAIAPLCAEGYVVEHIQCAGAGHVEAPANTLVEQWRWMQARFDGEPLAGEACVVDAPRECLPL